ncbi:glycosyltransferase family 2 protein [Conexibacter sp. DBS9H8]|uniref:glycosyltransferase family 2 protein n=1 Tax=Conexibacter sp. DBS9H8 TaxID=2937801 RepID=UPI00200F8DA3|nr:glycosyltransferase family 2 protein [Conexibacter sp. DBS9H8]
MANPQLSVIVPAHNAEGTLAATLAALRTQEVSASFEVIVVDSASSDRTLQIARDLASADPRIRVLHNPAGEPASSRNLGVAAARGTLIAFTDADCVPDRNWLETGLDALERADLIQGRVLPAGRPGRYDRTLSVGHESGLYETANLLMHPHVFTLAGGFSPLPGFAENRPFGEDTWFAWRARRAGARTSFSAETVVHHAIFPRGPRGYISEQRRRGHFPALVRAVPELRRHFLYRHWFLSRRTAAFDLALLGGALAWLSRRPHPLGAALPYLLMAPRPAEVLADAVGAVALARASLATRTPVL